MVVFVVVIVVVFIIIVVVFAVVIFEVFVATSSLLSSDKENRCIILSSDHVPKNVAVMMVSSWRH